MIEIDCVKAYWECGIPTLTTLPPYSQTKSHKAKLEHTLMKQQG